MRKLILLLLLLPATMVCQAQTDKNLLETAAYYYEQKNYEKALEFYTKAENSRTTDKAIALHGQAESLLELKQYPALVETAKKLIRINNSYAEAHFLLGLGYFYQDKFDEATKACQKEIQYYPNSYNAYHLLGKSLEQAGKDVEALEAYSMAIRINPGFANALKSKTALEDKIKKRFSSTNHAITQPVKDIAINSDEPIRSASPVGTGSESINIRSLLDRAYAQLNNSLFSDAIQTYSEVLKHDPGNSTALQNRAWCNMRAMLYADAIKDYNAALSVTNLPSLRTRIYRDLAYCYYQRRDYNNALIATNNGLMVDRDNDQLIKYKNIIAQELEREQASVVLAKNNSIDQKPPVIEIYQPTPTRGMGIVRHDSEVMVRGRATDESGISSVTINGTPAQLSPDGTFQLLVKLTANATNKIYVAATDNRNNEAREAITVHNHASKNEGGLAGAPQNDQKGRYHLLVIATDKYYRGWQNLNNPAHDGKAIANELSKHYGFTTDTLINPTLAMVNKKIMEYQKRDFSQNDHLVIFIAGHGHYSEIEKEGFLVFSDGVTPENNIDGDDRWMSYHSLKSKVDAIKAGHILLVVDACFSGTIDPLIAQRGAPNINSGTGSGTGISFEEYSARIQHLTTRRFITSGEKEYVEDGVAGRNSPFTRGLLSALRSYGLDRGGVLLIEDLFPYLKALKSVPREGEFGSNEPGSNFIFRTVR